MTSHPLITPLFKLHGQQLSMECGSTDWVRPRSRVHVPSACFDDADACSRGASRLEFDKASFESVRCGRNQSAGNAHAFYLPCCHPSYNVLRELRLCTDTHHFSSACTAAHPICSPATDADVLAESYCEQQNPIAAGQHATVWLPT